MKRTHAPLLAAALAATLALGACSSDDDDTTAAPSPTETATQPPEIRPIEPQVNVAAKSVNSGAVIDRSQAPAADQAAVDALAAAVRDWLDAHLDDLQNGGPGKLSEVATPGLLDGADATLIDGVTTGLTSPDDPVRGAAYTLEVGHDGAPRWLSARITVSRHSGTSADATFVFVPSDEVPAVLIALEPRGGAA